MDGTQLLAHVGRHQKPYRVHAVAVQRLFCKVHRKAYLPHVQLLQLGEYLRRQLFRRCLSGIGQRLRRLPCLLLRLGQRLLQPRQRVAGILDLRQLRLAPGLIVQHILHGRAVLLFQPVQQVHPALHPVQLTGRHIQLAPLVLHGGRDVVDLAIRLPQPFIQLAESVIQMAYATQRVLGLPQGAKRSAAAVVAVQGIVRPGHRVQELLRVPEHPPPRRQLLLLAGLQLRPLQLLDLILQGVYPPGLFRLIHLQRPDLAPYICKVFILLSICNCKAFHPAKAVQIHNVLLLVQQLLPVVLPVDIQQSGTQCPQLSHCYRTAVDPAYVFAVGLDLPLQQQRPIRLQLDAQLLRQLRCHTGKSRADKRLFSPGADQLPAGPLPQYSAQTVDNNGLARAGLTGQGIEPRCEFDIRHLDNSDILNMQQLQHTDLPSSAQHLPHLFAEIRRVGTVVEYQQHRVVAGQRTHDIRILHAVQREGGGVGHAVHGLDDRQVLRVFR